MAKLKRKIGRLPSLSPLYFFFFFLLGSLTIWVLPLQALAYLTSDTDINWGYSNITLTTNGTKTSLTSLSTIDLSYNLNHSGFNSSFNLVFDEILNSSQGPLTWTRIGAGMKYYLKGFNGLRVIFDNQAEGVYLRSAPYIGFSLGVNNFSISSINGTNGYFNASGFDTQIRLGLEVVMSSSTYLNTQLYLINSPTTKNPKNEQEFSFSGTGVLIGLKWIQNRLF